MSGVKILCTYVLYVVFSPVYVFFGAVFPYTNHNVVAHRLNIFLGSVYTATYRKVHALLLY
jgi:hypothetical protein